MSEPVTEATPSATARGSSAPRRSTISVVVGWICRWLFASVRIAPGAVDHIRSLAAQGSVLYIMRQRSLVDYLLVTTILRREGLPVPEFANDLSAIWFRPLSRVMAAGVRRWRRARGFRRELREAEERGFCLRLVTEGRSALIFMRSRIPGMRLLAGRRRAIAQMRTGSDYLREIVHHQWTSDEPVALVPLGVIRGRGMRRKESRLATIFYSAQEMPTDLRRLLSLLWYARETSISVGVEIQLPDFMRQYQREGEERIVRRLARALQIFLYREERVVWGPPLLPKRQVRQMVLQDDELAALVRRQAQERNQPESQLWRQAERYFDEMAANFHGLYFAIIEFVFNRIWPRLFQGVEYEGLERVVECVKQHPVVLVPCHRSHFDYLILSYLFHLNYLSPPHIAAGLNLSFWPLGPLFRGAGAYFIRRSFEGNDLYRMVFNKYLTFLIRQGYTQEFFIEGGRSRTGKILTPKLGMLTAIIEAFIEGIRRDLYFVPVSIHYGRVVEEDAYQRELGGQEKQTESLGALLRARKLLRQRRGTVYITFAEPISLNDTLGGRKERFRNASDPAVVEEKRRFIQKLGFRLLRDVNDVAVAGATSVSSTVLLSLSQRACRQSEFVTRALALTEFLRFQQVRFTASLERNLEGEFRENLSFLESGGLIRRLAGDDGGIIHVPTEKRRALDFYKNNGIHFLLLAALLVDGLTRGLRGAALKDDVIWWLDLFRWEFALPEREALAESLGRTLDYLRQQSALTNGNGELLASRHPIVQSTIGILDNFREAYWIASQVAATVPEGGLARSVLLERMRKRFADGLLLGEVSKPEGNSSVMFGNAVSRLTEIGCIRLRPGKGKDMQIQRGDAFAQLPSLAGRIAESTVRQ